MTRLYRACRSKSKRPIRHTRIMASMSIYGHHTHKYKTAHRTSSPHQSEHAPLNQLSHPRSSPTYHRADTRTTNQPPPHKNKSLQNHNGRPSPHRYPPRRAPALKDPSDHWRHDPRCGWILFLSSWRRRNGRAEKGRRYVEVCIFSHQHGGLTGLSSRLPESRRRHTESSRTPDGEIGGGEGGAGGRDRG